MATNYLYTPFDWDFVDDKSLIYDSNSSKTDEEIKEMIDNALSEALEDTLSETVDSAVDEAIGNMDIKLEGEKLLYKLIVNGSENGEINIPKDQFLKSVSYDSDNKKLIFVMETVDGNSTTEVSISDLVASIEDGVGQIQGKLSEIDEKDNAQDSAIADKADASALELLATKEEVAAIETKVDAIDLTPYATIEALNQEIERATDKEDELTETINTESVRATAAESELQGKDAELLAKIDTVDAKKVEWVESTPDRKHIVLNNHDSVLGTATNNETYNLAMVSKWDVADFGSSQLHLNLNSKDGIVTINDNKVVAVQDDITNSIASAIEPLATKQEVNTAAANAVAQVVANAPEDLDTLKEVADYISSDKTKANEIETKLGEHDSAIESLESVKADKTEITPLATKEEVAVVDAKVNAIVIPDVSGFAMQTVVDEELAEKANADDVYTKDESDEKFQVSGDYVPVEEYNELVQKFAALENYVNIFIKDREEKMDEIISNMDADNKEVVIETPMESIVVPETTTAYTITAPLADNSTVELTSPKYMTLFNTSEQPVSTSISHTPIEGETTTATAVYLVGDFDTLTLENVNPSVKSGYDAASVNNVVITENNAKNLTLALNIQDGATITNNSDASITILDKNDMATTLTIVAPNSTVTLNGSTYEVVNATVSDNTLIIKKNVSHIDSLNVDKGNVIVEVARQSLIAEKIGEYTLAQGYTIDYLHDEIDSTNVANLAKEGTHTLVEDVAKSGNFSVSVLSSDDIVWDLNGHNITSSNTRGYGIFRLRGSAHLEVNDSIGTGIVKNTDDDYGLWAGTADCKIVINGGNFEASTHVLYAEKGTIEVNGGTFKLTNWETADKDESGNLRYLINCHDADYVSGAAKIIVRGGKFYDFDPANCAAEGAGTSFVAEGYGSVMTTEIIDGVEHRVYEVKPINE